MEILQLSERIKFRRKQLGYTQKDIAELTQLSERTVRAIENAESNSSIIAWQKILDVLGLEMKIAFKPISDETGKGLL